MYNEETLNRWNLTEEECDKAIRKITIKGMRLTYDEKSELFFEIMEGLTDGNDEEAMRESIEFSREMTKKMEEDRKKVREFVKEWRRLEVKYNSLNSDIEDKSLDELTDMWINNYFELYFMEDHFDCLEENPKGYAQYYCYNVGICPESEVSIWRD